MKKTKRPRRDKEIYCPIAGKSKLQFTKAAAIDFIRRNRETILEESGYAPDHEYYCPACGCYHVTSYEKKQKQGEIGYCIDPYLTIVFRKLTKAMINLVEGKNYEALIKIRESVPIIFWELRLTKYKVNEKYLQKLIKEFIKEIAPEIKALGKKTQLSEERLLYYENKLTEIEEEGGKVLHSIERTDTTHLSPILGRRDELGEDQFRTCLECLSIIRKLSAMSIIKVRSTNQKNAWDKLEDEMEKIQDPEAHALIEKMRDLLY